jgi:FAD synthase
MVCSVGWNPTFNNKEKSVEAYLMHDFKESASSGFYGEEMALLLCAYIRPELPFKTLGEFLSVIFS